jgi:single stranded DNA-binding protein
VAGFNKVILMGNLTRNPELRYTPSGTPVASFGLAVSRRFKQGDDLKEEVCFVDIVVFGKQAEHCGQYLSKGNGAQQARGGCTDCDVHAQAPRKWSQCRISSARRAWL